MRYEYEPIKDLEKEIEYVRWTHERETRTHEKAVIRTQLEKLETRLHKFKQAAKADEYEAKAKAFDAYHSIISNHIEQQYSHNKHDMVKRFVKIHDEYERGESE